MLRALCSVALVLVAGCPTSTGGTGGSDAGVQMMLPDASHLTADAGPAMDAAVGLDAALPADAAEIPDAATEKADAALLPDAAVPDAGPPRSDAPAIPCMDNVDNVYITPLLLPPFSDATRGDIVRCALLRTDSAPTLQQQLTATGVNDVTATSGSALYRIAFRTRLGTGEPGISTALVYLPLVPHALPMPKIVVGHPTTGIADQCAVSQDQALLNQVTVPWAATGYPVIAPDHPGLGNEGTLAYLDNRESGQTLLDGARALEKLMASGLLDERVLMVGYSQGGGSVLSAQALEAAYGTAGHVVGVIGYAPQWPTQMNSFGYVDMLRNPDALTITTGVSKAVIHAMRTYSYFYNRVGPTHALDGFPALERTNMHDAIEDLCFVALGGSLQVNQPFLREIFDETLRTTFLGCVDGTPACAEPGQSWFAFHQQNFLPANPLGAPILYVQGLTDQILPPQEEAACNVQRMIMVDGVIPQVCSDAAGSHANIVQHKASFGLQWGEAALAAQTLPVCPATNLPPCTN